MSVRIKVNYDQHFKLHPNVCQHLKAGDHIYLDAISPMTGRATYRDANGVFEYLDPGIFETVKQTNVEITCGGGAFHPETEEPVVEGDCFAVDEVDRSGFAFYDTSSGDPQVLSPSWYRIIRHDEAFSRLASQIQTLAMPGSCVCPFIILSQLGCQCGART